jgi:tRNA(fMet)-specific endonuclease VapC
MRYLLDADWVIDALADRRNAASRIKELSSDGIGISIVTLGEVYEGAFGFAVPEQQLLSLRRFLAPFPVVPLSDPIMERFARLRSQLRRQGKIVPDFDLLVAATATEHDLTLLTRNVRHFERIPDLTLYQPD